MQDITANRRELYLDNFLPFLKNNNGKIPADNITPIPARNKYKDIVSEDI